MNRRHLLLGSSSLFAATAIARAMPQDSKPERVLVAGATGSIGKFVVRDLLEQGHAVRGLTRNPEKAAKARPEVEWVFGDFKDPKTLEGITEGTDRIIFAAGSKSWSDPSNTPELVDFGGVRELTDRGLSTGTKRVVVISSVGTVNPITDGSDHLKNVLKWKGAAEKHLRESRMPHSILRPLGMWDEPGRKMGIALLYGDTVRASVTISREDLAMVSAVAAFHPDAENKSFELFNAAAYKIDGWKRDLAKLPRESKPAAEKKG